MLECSSLIDNNSLQLHVIAAKHERYKYISASVVDGVNLLCKQAVLHKTVLLYASKQTRSMDTSKLCNIARRLTSIAVGILLLFSVRCSTWGRHKSSYIYTLTLGKARLPATTSTPLRRNTTEMQARACAGAFSTDWNRWALPTRGCNYTESHTCCINYTHCSAG